MKATVVLITYNHVRYIRQAIESVLAQETDFDFELLISDDCSTDGTREIVNEYARRHPDKIRLRLNQVNRFSNEDFEQAMLAARGEYIALLEGDDYWTSKFKLQKAIDFLEHHSDYSMWWHQMEYVDANGHLMPIQPPPPSKLNFTLQDFFVEGPISCVGAAVIRKSCIQPPFPCWFYSNPLGDYVLWIVCAMSGPAHQSDETLGAYRIHSEGYYNKRDEEGRAEIAAASFHDLFIQVDAEWQKQLSLPVARYCATLASIQKKAGKDRTSRETALKGLVHCPREIRLLILAYIPWAWSTAQFAQRLAKWANGKLRRRQ